MKAPIAIATLICCCVLSTAALSMVMIEDEIRWPEDWQSQLRHVAAEGATHYVSTALHEVVFELQFKSREDFLESWPYLAELISPSAPVTVKTVQPVQNPKSSWKHNAPVVRVHAPSRGIVTGVRDVKGRLDVAPPWPQEIIGPDGSLPEWVQVIADEGVLKLAPAIRDDAYTNTLHRCRVEIQVIADERIIYKSDIYRMHGDGVYIDADAPAPEAEPGQLRLHWELPGISNNDATND